MNKDTASVIFIYKSIMCYTTSTLLVFATFALKLNRLSPETCVFKGAYSHPIQAM